MLRSAAVNKMGVSKTVWEEKPIAFEEDWMNMSEQEMLLRMQMYEDEGFQVEVTESEILVEVSEETMLNPETGEELIISSTESSGNYTVRCERMEETIKIDILPPEEFIINEDTTSINDDGLTRFIGHRREMHKNDAMIMFPDVEESKFGNWDSTIYEYEKAARHSIDGTYRAYGENTSPTQDTAQVELLEFWIKADRNRDGIAEWRHGFVSGSNLLMDEEWFGPLPFSSYTYFPVPHKFYGLSVWDRVRTYDEACLLYTSPSPRDRQKSRMPSSA